jgi:hypothetical protein
MNINVFPENAPSLRFHVLSFPWPDTLDKCWNKVLYYLPPCSRCYHRQSDLQHYHIVCVRLGNLVTSFNHTLLQRFLQYTILPCMCVIPFSQTFFVNLRYNKCSCASCQLVNIFSFILSSPNLSYLYNGIFILSNQRQFFPKAQVLTFKTGYTRSIKVLMRVGLLTLHSCLKVGAH